MEKEPVRGSSTAGNARATLDSCELDSHAALVPVAYSFSRRLLQNEARLVAESRKLDSCHRVANRP